MLFMFLGGAPTEKQNIQSESEFHRSEYDMNKHIMECRFVDLEAKITFPVTRWIFAEGLS